MKISLGVNLQPGPFGGGNQAGRALAKYLVERGHSVHFDLKEPSLDIILLAEPRSELRISAFTDLQVVRYLRRYPNAVVVHRVNECDERKGTRGVNRILRRANLCADHTVFVSDWLKRLHMRQGMPASSSSTILNGSDLEIFNSDGYSRWTDQGPLLIVTHHWGAHWMKGFDVYSKLDRLLASSEFGRQFSFTYIGNVPSNFGFRKSRHVSPIAGHELADELRRHHVYLTASMNEPGANHQNEGANCGLPLIYRNSGCLPEYCEGFGIMFDDEGDFLDKLYLMRKRYSVFVDRMEDYPRTAARATHEYHRLFKSLLAQRDFILSVRDPGHLRKWLLEYALTEGPFLLRRIKRRSARAIRELA